jgi:DNA-binding ferritin-like protein
MINARAASDYIARILHGVTMAHMHHLMVMGHGSYAAHMALGELYAALQEKADGLAEEVMGCYDVPLVFSGGTCTISDNPIADVAALYEFAESTRGVVGYESHIQNTVDEICSALATALYKLRRLQ